MTHINTFGEVTVWRDRNDMYIVLHEDHIPLIVTDDIEEAYKVAKEA